MKSTHDRFGITRRVLLTTAATLSILSASALSVLKQARAQTDPLASWKSYAGFWVTRLIRRRGEPAFQ